MHRRHFVCGAATSVGLIAFASAGLALDTTSGDFSADKSGQPPEAPALETPPISKKGGHDEILGKVDADRLYDDVRHLQTFETRLTGTPGNAAAGDWIDSQFQTHGHAAGKGSQQTFKMPDGSDTSNRLYYPFADASSYILICAHYDATSEKPSDSAPGADDNATGVAVLLEISRALVGVKLQKGLILACFSGEEQGLVGSQVCADIAAKEHWPIDLLVNLDMVGFAKAEPANIVVEYDHGNRVLENDQTAAAYGAILGSLAQTAGGLSAKYTDIWNSDYMPFEAKGYPCVGLYDDGAEEPFYHSTRDTTDNVNKEKLASVARSVLATILEVGVLTT